VFDNNAQFHERFLIFIDIFYLTEKAKEIRYEYLTCYALENSNKNPTPFMYRLNTCDEHVHLDPLIATSLLIQKKHNIT